MPGSAPTSHTPQEVPPLDSHSKGGPCVVKVQPVHGEEEVHFPYVIEGHHNLLGQLGHQENCPRDVPLPAGRRGRCARGRGRYVDDHVNIATTHCTVTCHTSGKNHPSLTIIKQAGIPLAGRLYRCTVRTHGVLTYSTYTWCTDVQYVHMVY